MYVILSPRRCLYGVLTYSVRTNRATVVATKASRRRRLTTTMKMMVPLLKTPPMGVGADPSHQASRRRFSARRTIL